MGKNMVQLRMMTLGVLCALVMFSSDLDAREQQQTVASEPQENNAAIDSENDTAAKAVASEEALKQMNGPSETVPLPTQAPDNPPPFRKVEASGFDVQMRRLGDAMALGLKRLPGDHRDQFFAVFPFDNVGEETENRQLGLVVSEHIMTDLVRTHRFNLVERGSLNQIIAEQGLSQMGLVDADKAVSVGALAGAQALVVGQVIDKGPSFQVTARVVDAKTGQVFVAELVEVSKGDLLAFSADAVVLRSKGAAAIRSMLVPGWGQFYNRQKMKAAVVGGAMATSLLAAGVSYGLGYSLEQNYLTWAPVEGANVTQEDQVNLAEMRATANMQYSLAGGFAGAAALVWVFGITDAYFSGVDAESLDDAMAEF
ncbi:MAG: hypothetical protein CMH56_14215 [Myxococcales bacterium]|nr:hypothetical protein [Myxococcales bacterium]